MDNTLFNFTNTSDTTQEISLFETTALGSESETEIVWNFRNSFSNYNLPSPNDIYNVATGLWWDTTVVNVQGGMIVNVNRNDGTTAGIGFSPAPFLNDLTTVAFQTSLNAFAPFNQMGEWEIQGPVADAQGFLSEFNIRLTLSKTFIDAQNIDTSPSANFGCKSLHLLGGGVWSPITTTPSGTQVGNMFVSNPNINIQNGTSFSYSDFLWSAIGRTYNVKNFQLFSDNKQQLIQPFLFDRTLATGRVYQKVLTPTIDPYQYQNYIITPEQQGYILDGFTKIKYTLLPQASIRLMMDYTYVDLSTPLIAELASPQINQSHITPEFVKWQELGYDKFGCKFLADKIKGLNEELTFEQSAPRGNIYPKRIEIYKERLMYLKQMMISYDCIKREESEEIPEFKSEEIPEFKVIGPELKRLNLWMPSPEFVQSQLDDEQGARKLFRNHDFPIVKE